MSALLAPFSIENGLWLQGEAGAAWLAATGMADIASASGSPPIQPQGFGGSNPTSSGSAGTIPHFDSGGTRGGKGAKPEENPNAQKRFRARQKERLSCLEREVAEKKAAFDQLNAENVVLKQRTNILEKVVSCRDEQLGMMTALEERCLAGSEGPGCFGGKAVVLGSPDAQEAFRKMKKEQVIPQYKAFLTEVSSALLHCQHPCCDSDNPVVQKVTASVERMGYMLKHLVLLNGQLMRQLLSLNLETLQPSTATESHWDDVVSSLQLVPQQRSDILAVYDMYRGLMAKVYEERKLLMMALGEGVGTVDATTTTFTQLRARATGPGGADAGAAAGVAINSSGRDMCERNDLASEMELMEKLNVNMGKEHSARTLLCCFFFGKVLAAPQFAKVAVYSYPYFPDSLAVASAVARLPGCVPANR